jgi:hypothetical protein
MKIQYNKNMKKILLLLLLMAPSLMFGQLDTINLGSPNVANDGETGLTAWPKINTTIRLLNTLQIYNLNTEELQILNGALFTATEGNQLVGLRTDSTVQDQIDATQFRLDTAKAAIREEIDAKIDEKVAALDAAAIVAPSRAEFVDSIAVQRDSLNILRDRIDAQDAQFQQLLVFIQSSGGGGLTFVNSISVLTVSGDTALYPGATFDFNANVEPDIATDTTGYWTLIEITGTATLDTVGKQTQPTLTATSFGTVKVRYTANDPSGVYGERLINITYPTFSEEYQAVFDAKVVKPSMAHAVAENTMVESLVSAGYWARMHYGNIYATESTAGAEALINWINPGTNDADLDGTSPTWDNLEGFTGVGSSYISTNFNPFGVVSQNSATAIIYIRSNVNETKNVYSSRGGGYFEFIPRDASSDFAHSMINTTSGEQIATGVTDASGLWINTRRGATEIEMYRNGTSVDTEADASGAVPNGEFFIFKTGTTYATQQVSMFWVMDAVSDAEAAALNTIFETYMDAIGTGIQ